MDKYLGESVPKLGFGLMRLPQDGDRIDVPQVSAMADLFLESGFRYFDSSWAYPGSEEAFHEAVASRHPRESYLFATKCPVWMARDRDAAHEMFSTSLERSGAGYFDFYLMHNLGEHRTKYFDEYGMWDFVRRQKERGLIRHIGFSFHDKASVLDQILTAHPEVEFVQLQLNYADWENSAVESRKCHETARRHGKSVVVMEPVKGGLLARLPQSAVDILKSLRPDMSIPSWGIRFAASLDGIITVLSGMSSLEQMRDNISYMKSFEPLGPEELSALDKVRAILAGFRSIPCTSCRYCVEVCPQAIPVPNILEALNINDMYGNNETARGRYRVAIMGRSSASDCLKCGRCEEACPQHIEIRSHLERAVNELA